MAMIRHRKRDDNLSPACRALTQKARRALRLPKLEDAWLEIEELRCGDLRGKRDGLLPADVLAQPALHTIRGAELDGAQHGMALVGEDALQGAGRAEHCAHAAGIALVGIDADACEPS